MFAVDCKCQKREECHSNDKYQLKFAVDNARQMQNEGNCQISLKKVCSGSLPWKQLNTRIISGTLASIIFIPHFHSKRIVALIIWNDNLSKFQAYFKPHTKRVIGSWALQPESDGHANSDRFTTSDKMSSLHALGTANGQGNFASFLTFHINNNK